MRALVLRAEVVPAASIARRVAGKRWRNVRILQLARVARDDAHPRPARRMQRRKGDHVVLDDHVGPQLVDDLAEPRLDVLRAVAERLPRRLDKTLELLDRRPAEDGRRIAD